RHYAVQAEIRDWAADRAADPYQCRQAAHEPRPREAGLHSRWRLAMFVLDHSRLVFRLGRGLDGVFDDVFKVFLSGRLVRGFDFAEHLERIALLRFFIVSEIHGATLRARHGLRALTPSAATLMPNRRVTFARGACASSAQACRAKRARLRLVVRCET